MRAVARFTFFWILLAVLPQFAFATAAVSGKLVNPNPSVALPIGSVARLDLRNCGGNYPVVSGASVTSRQEFPIATDGTWSGVLYRNDEISCNSAFTTYYTLSYFIRNIQSGPSRDYICSQASCAFDTMTPMTVYPPPTPPAQPLTGAQSVSCTFTAATTWTCLNTLNTASVIVDLYDGSGNQLVKGVGSGPTSVVAIVNSVTATFASPSSGTMYVVNAGNWTPSVSSPNNIIANPSAPQSISGQGLTLTSSAPLNAAGNNSFPGTTSLPTVSNLNGIYYVDGTTYPLTTAGVNAAITAANAAGGGKVMITKPMTTTGNFSMLGNVSVECAGPGARITWAGSSYPASFFFGVSIANIAVRNCYMSGPNMANTPIPVLTTSTSGGSLGAGVTVFVKTTYVNASGETMGSAEASVTTGAGSTNSVTVAGQPVVLPATGYTVYSSLTTGTEKQQAASGNCVNIAANCVIQVIGAGAAVPTTSSAAIDVDLRCWEFDGTNNHFEEFNNCTGVSYGGFETSGGQYAYMSNNVFTHTTKSAQVTFDNHVASKFNAAQLVGRSNLDHCNYHSGGADVLSEGNSCAYVQGYCVQVFGSTAAQENELVRVVNGSCQNSGQAGSGSRGGVVMTYSAPSTFCRHMVVSGYSFDGVSGDRVISVGECTEIAITNNVFRNSQAATMVYVKPNAVPIANLVIANNIGLTNTSSQVGMQFDASVQAISNVTLTGNIINTAASTCYLLSGAQGITNVTATGNIGKSCGVDGFSISNTSNSNFGLNRLVATGNGFTVAASSSDNTVAFNTLIGSAAGLADSGVRTVSFCNKFNTTDNTCTLNSALLSPSGSVGSPSRSFSTDATTGAWLAGAGDYRFSAASTQVLRLVSSGALATRFKSNQGTNYSGADAAIVLSAGWGTTRTVSGATGFDSDFSFAANSSGTGQGASPTITITFKDGTAGTAPQAQCSRNDLSSPDNAPPHTITTSATQMIITFNGTPVAGNAYSYTCHVGWI